MARLLASGSAAPCVGGCAAPARYRRRPDDCPESGSIAQHLLVHLVTARL
jgi:hypothetical protein